MVVIGPGVRGSLVEAVVIPVPSMPAVARKVDEYAREFMLPVIGVLSEKRIVEILADCKRMLKQGVDDPAAVHATIGHAYARLGKHEEALEYYRNATLLQPASADYKICLGAELMRNGLLVEALEQFADAAEHSNLSQHSRVVAYADAAEVLMMLGQPEDARAAMQTAISTADQSDLRDVFVLSLQCAELGADWEAIEFFARYCALFQGIPRGTAPAVEVIRDAPRGVHEILASPDVRRLAGAVAKVTSHGAHCEPLGQRSMRSPSEASSDEADAVFHDMASLREEANIAAMGDEHHA